MSRLLSMLLSWPLALAAAASLHAQTWFAQTPASQPSARYGHDVAFDPVRNYTVLFGGWATARGPVADTWTWNGTSWSFRSTTAAPSAREGHSMAYDPGRGGVVLFGGYIGSTNRNNNETWLWTGANWAPILSAVSPSPRSYHTMAYHAGLGGIVLFGGDGPSFINPETWLLSSAGWTQLFPTFSPPYFNSSYSNSMDSMSNNTLLYNGASSARGLWEFTGTTWNMIPSPIPPSNIFACELAPISNGALAAIRNTASTLAIEMWRWDGQQWNLRPTAISPTVPVGCYVRQTQLALDSARRRYVLFSGTVCLSDTWEYDNTAYQASASVYGTGCGTPRLTLAPLAGSRPLLGAAFTATVSGTLNGPAWVALGQSNTVYVSFPLPLPLDGLGFTGCSLYQDLVVTGLPTVAGSPATWTIPIPNLGVLIGRPLFLQSYALAPSSPGGLSLSNGAELVLGNY